MDLKAKLSAYRSKKKEDAKPQTTLSPSAIARYLPGSWQDTLLGPCFVGEEHFPLDFAHGRVRLHEVHKVGIETILLFGKDPALAEFDLAKALFLDTETTGLAGGTGTMAFLIGAGFFTEREFILRRYFVGDYPEEAAVLWHFNELLRERPHLVTFNGKCFDWPLLTARLTLNRLTPAVENPLHLDLLHPSRRCFKARLDSCRLAVLEEKVLQVHRSGDVPGELIPNLYFEYLRTKDPAPLAPVFRHNRLDILSLVTLTARLGAIIGEPHLELADGADLLSVGKLYEDRHMFDQAMVCYRTALEMEVPPAVRYDILYRLSLLLKRSGKWPEALAAWREMAAAGGYDLFPYEEMAKFYEHQAKDYNEALAVVEQAGKVLKQRHSLLPLNRWRQEREEWEKRQLRLEKKSRKG